MKRDTWFWQLCCFTSALLFVFGMMPTFLLGQEGIARLFDEANVLYQQQEYDPALRKYRQIEQQGLVSMALFYNIANCYYKQDRIGKAIVYYERAKRLDPRDEDINANLAIANQATVDKITPPSEFAFSDWLTSRLSFVPRRRVLRLAALFYLAVTALVVVFFFSRETFRGRIGSLIIIGVALLFGTVGLAVFQWWESGNRVEAVLQTDEISVKSSPGKAGIEVFTIHEGIKVRIGQETDAWVEIVLPDGKTGWIPDNSLEII